jgi:hypothetical protein
MRAKYWNTWFRDVPGLANVSLQNGLYQQGVSDSYQLVGISVRIPMIQYAQLFAKGISYQNSMVPVCSRCTFRGSGGSSNTSGARSLSSCIALCISVDTCTAMSYVNNSCWIQTLKSAASDGFWNYSTIPVSTNLNNGQGCVDTSGWRDVQSKTCADYAALRLCAVINGTGGYGPGWATSSYRTGTFSTYRASGFDASTACCQCGKNGTAFSVYLKQGTFLTVVPEQTAADIVCRPKNFYPNVSDSAQCFPPFQVFNFTIPQNFTNVKRCCVNPYNYSISVALEDCFTTGLCENTTNYPLISFDLTQNRLVLNRTGLRPLWTAGSANLIARLSISKTVESVNDGGSILNLPGANGSAVVLGPLTSLTLIRRGTGYLQDPPMVVNSLALPEYHSQRFKFRNASFRITRGFSGIQSGSFDGTELDTLCSKKQEEDGICSRSSPYGMGYGPCIGLSFASGSKVVASTSALDIGKGLNFGVAGISALDTFVVDGERHVVAAVYLDAAAAAASANGDPAQAAAAKANATRTRSRVYTLSENATSGELQLSLLQELRTVAATDVTHFRDGGRIFIVFVQETEPVSPLFEWSPAARQYRLVQYIPTQQASRAEALRVPSKDSQQDSNYLLVAQAGDAIIPSQSGPLSPYPMSLGPAMTEDTPPIPGQSVMLRWNGSSFTSVATAATVRRDYPGGQAFHSSNAAHFMPWGGGIGGDGTLAVLLNGGGDNGCADNPYWRGKGDHKTCADLARFLTSSNTPRNRTLALCQSSGAHGCDACPSLCGTCCACNSLALLLKYPANCNDTESSGPLLNSLAECGKAEAGLVSLNETSTMQEVLKVLSKTGLIRVCDACDACREAVLGVIGRTFGPSRNARSQLLIGRGEDRVVGLAGAAAVVVSPDGQQVYVASYWTSAVAAFDRSATSGLLLYSAAKGFGAAPPLAGCGGGVSSRGSGMADCWSGSLRQGLSALAVSPDGAYLYAAAYVGALHVLRRDPNGMLALVGTVLAGDDAGGGRTVMGLRGARGLALSPGGGAVYVAAAIDQAVSAFRRDPYTGAVAFLDSLRKGERDFSPAAFPRVPATGGGGFPAQLLPGGGGARAAAVFEMDGTVYVAVAAGVDAAEPASVLSEGNSADSSGGGIGFAAVLRWRMEADRFELVQVAQSLPSLNGPQR